MINLNSIVPLTLTLHVCILFSNLSYSQCTPTNDLISGAIPITCGTGSYTGSTTCATSNDYPGVCNTNPSHSPGIWYSIAGINGAITIDLCTSSSYDTQISVWKGNPNNLTCVNGNDDTCGLASKTTISSTVGVTYYIYVFGHTNDPTGNFTLTLNCSCTSVVSNTNDSGYGSLRDAVDCAVNGSTITFDNATNGQAIGLTSGQILINKDLVFFGNGRDLTIIDGFGDPNSRLFQILNGNTVHFEGITFQHGGGSNFSGAGAGIDSEGITSCSNCKFANNNSTYVGNSIHQNTGSLEVVNSKFIDNGLIATGNSESVIWTQNNVSTSIHQCLFVGNDTEAELVAAITGSDLEFIQNTVSNNAAGSESLYFQNTGTLNVFNNIFNETGNILAYTSSANVTTGNNLLEHSDPQLPASANNIVGAAMLDADYTLMTGSPAIAAGNNNSIPADILDINANNNTVEPLPIDYFGNPRNIICTADIGAAVFQGSRNSPNDLVHTALDYPAGLYEVNQTITSSAKVQVDVIYKAGISVELLGGFEVMPGQIFEATIGVPCSQ